MMFLNRTRELARLNRLLRSADGGLAVVVGRRRVGKTRLLVEWAQTKGGIYFVADESSPTIHRRYLAEAIATRLPGFADVQYPDWRALLKRLAAEAKNAHFRGPIVIDELPYLVSASAELPSVLQQWVDHEVPKGQLIVALAGSSQRMMAGLVLAENAPLFGRATEFFNLEPLEPQWLSSAFTKASPQELLNAFTAWGGIPRYWELASHLGGKTADAIETLVLDPQGPLHHEPSRLLLEELPSAAEARPLLDAIGHGASRLSEIASRVGRPATSLARPLERLTEMSLVTREVPFGESPRGGKRALYRLSDPFFRLWFRVVAPNRGLLETNASARHQVLAQHWPALRALAFEQLCRQRLPTVEGLPGKHFKAGQRWWQGNQPEWDLVSESLDGTTLLLGEARALERPMAAATFLHEAQRLMSRPLPELPAPFINRRIVRALFVPEIARGVEPNAHGVVAITLSSLGLHRRVRSSK